MKLTDTQRALLLSRRDLCEHGNPYACSDGDRWECDNDHSPGHHVLSGGCRTVHCPGGAAVAVECETCDGKGYGEHHVEGIGVKQVDCPDCVDGIRLLRGELIEICVTHSSTGDHRLEQCHQVIGWHKLSRDTADACVFEVQWKDNLK